VTLNGSLLFNGTDYTATNGTSVVLASGATASDVLQVTSFKSFTTADMVPASTGGTFSGNVNVTGSVTSDGLTVDGAATITVTDNSDALTLISTDADANVGPVLNLYRNSASPADNDVLGRVLFKGEDDAGNEATFARIQVTATDVSNGSEDARIDFIAAKDDTFNAALSVVGDKIGIGTSSPDALLNLSFNESAAYSSTGEPREDVIIHNINGADSSGVNNYATLGFHVASGATSQGFLSYIRTADNTGAFTFSQRTGSSSYAEAMRIDSSGNTTFKTSAGHLSVEALGGGSVKLNSNGSMGMNVAAGYSYEIDVGDSEVMRIDSSGNVGIGTSSPTGSLSVSNDTYLSNSSTVGSSITLNSENTASWSGSRELISFESVGNGADHRTGTLSLKLKKGASDSALTEYMQINAVSNYTTFSTDGSERMRIDSSGLVGIGKVPSSATGSMLQVEGGDGIAIRRSGQTNHFVMRPLSSSDGDGIRFTQEGVGERMRIDSSGNLLVGTISSGQPNENYFQARDASGFQVAVGHANTVSNGQPYFYMTYNGLGIGSITQASGSSVAYNTSSDYRLKENVADLTGATARLKQLEPKRFNFIADADRTVDGFLAHEVQSVVPEAITGTHNEVDDDDNPVYQGIDQSKLVPLLTAALQEAIAKIETLETEMTSVKGRLDALEAN